MSPGSSSKAAESWLICSATDQIMSFRSADWTMRPLTLRVMLPAVGWPVSATGWMGPMGAERSKLLPISQGFFWSPMKRCRSRRVMSRPMA